MAVKRVTSSSGAKTPGIDGVVWKTGPAKLKAVKELWNTLKCLDKYKAQPVLRVWIEKANSTELRPLGIPTIRDRALQQIYLLAIDPVEESKAPEDSYGFRAYRNSDMAIARIQNILADRRSEERWILDADISKCFDKISHSSILERVVVPNKHPIAEWLRAPIAEPKSLAPRKKLKYYGKRRYTNAKIKPADRTGYNYQIPQVGTPQGGVISPLLCNIVLNDMSKVIDKINASKSYKQYTRKILGTRARLYLIRYADDFIVIGPSRKVVERAQLAIEKFLKTRGLDLSKKKTRLIHITEGFDFLGWNIKRYPINSRLNGTKKGEDGRYGKPSSSVLIVKPTKLNQRMVRQKLNKVFKSNHNSRFDLLLGRLNPILRGWANYYKNSYHSWLAFRSLNGYTYNRMGRYLKRKYRTNLERHYDKLYKVNARVEYGLKIRNKLFMAPIWDGGKQPWLFDPTMVEQSKIYPHKKGQNIYTPLGRYYWETRKFTIGGGITSSQASIYEKWNWKCGHCKGHLALSNAYWLQQRCTPLVTDILDIENHRYVIPGWAGGTYASDNVMPVHKECHPQAQKITDEAILKWYGFDKSTRDNRAAAKEKVLEAMEKGPLARHIYFEALLREQK
jgi:retron-type reverse transcriptase